MQQVAILHKPQALGQIGSGYKQLAEFARKVETRRLELPAGCYINFDLELIEDNYSPDYKRILVGPHQPCRARFKRKKRPLVQVPLKAVG